MYNRVLNPEQVDFPTTLIMFVSFFQGQIRYHRDLHGGLAVLDVSWYTRLLSALYENWSDLAENYTKSLTGDTPVSRENKVLKSIAEKLPAEKVCHVYSTQRVSHNLSNRF